MYSYDAVRDAVAQVDELPMPALAVPKPVRATSRPASLTSFVAFLPAYAATNRVRLRDATMVDSADAPAGVARQSRYA